ncbi:MAG: histidine kinase, partial [Mycobacteriales bacterium]
LVSGLLAGTYVTVVVLLARAAGRAVGESPIAIAVATLAVAAAARPVHAAVQDAVDRRFSRRRFAAMQRVRRFVAAPSPSTSVEAVLREALADPGLDVAYWLAEREEWVTAAGVVTRPRADGTAVHRAGRLVAMVGCALEPGLVRAVLDEAAPELDNAGLRAAVAMQLEEVRASRARIASAQLEERRRIERDLHDGAQQRLLGLAAHLQAALLNGHPDRLKAALGIGVAECRTAVIELRELANGLHPLRLSDGGLAAALDDLAGRVPVRLVTDLSGRRYPPEIEATAWFVVCEGVANALKHAGPATVEVQATDRDCLLRVTVDDDGRGGADPDGSGLRGLADRAEAVGGHLQVKRGANLRGTRLQVVLPCGS